MQEFKSTWPGFVSLRSNTGLDFFCSKIITLLDKNEVLLKAPNLAVARFFNISIQLFRMGWYKVFPMLCRKLNFYISSEVITILRK